MGSSRLAGTATTLMTKSMMAMALMAKSMTTMALMAMAVTMALMATETVRTLTLADLQLEVDPLFLIPPDKIMVTRGPCLVWRDPNFR